MRRIVVFVISSLALQICAVPLQARQTNLDPLGSFLSSVFVPAATTTTDDAATSATSATSRKGPKDKSTASELTIDAPTSTSSSVEPSSSTESSSSATSTSSSTSQPTSTSSSTSSSTLPHTTSATPTPVPSSPVNGANTSPTVSNNNSGPSISSAGIAVAVIMSLAVLIAIFVVLWKFWGPIVRWREKRSYVKMQERSYRPTLDGPFAQNNLREKALGKSNTIKTNRASVMSFLALARPRHQIKRKPVPISPITPGTGTRTSMGGTGVSPLIELAPPRFPSTASSKAEKALPSLPEEMQQ